MQSPRKWTQAYSDWDGGGWGDDKEMFHSGRVAVAASTFKTKDAQGFMIRYLRDHREGCLSTSSLVWSIVSRVHIDVNSRETPSIIFD